MKPFDDTISDICTHLGDEYGRRLGASAPPLYQTTLFVQDDRNPGYAYTRVANPTGELLEQKLAALEHAPAALGFASGMGAIGALLLSLLQAGDHAVMLRSSYCSASSLLREALARYGVTCDFVEHGTPAEFEAATCPNTRLYYFESPSSNIFRVLDIRAITALAAQKGVKTAMDNTWATPVFQNPMDMGVD
ncbi:MAG: cystathionine beta-lyase/cystathionine gamma-synthase, partial [Clostridiales bacterium]|nr:cystathionine beta-lyase/cystathionine gamma-synthase [Clostridiales bacterium]